MKYLVLLVTALVMSVNTMATPLNLQGGVTPYVTTATTQFVAVGSQVSVGGNLYLNAPSDLTFTFLGANASYLNEFRTGFMSIFNTDPVGTSITRTVYGDKMQFKFKGNSAATLLKNGDNTFSEDVKFATLFNHGGYDAILLFDDGGNYVDEDYDDMVIGINVPAPATVAMLGLGLLGFGLMRKRNK